MTLPYKKKIDAVEDHLISAERELSDASELELCSDLSAYETLRINLEIAKIHALIEIAWALNRLAEPVDDDGYYATKEIQHAR